MQCCATRGDQDHDEDSSFGGLFAGLWPATSHGTAGRRPTDYGLQRPADVGSDRSADVVGRHVAALPPGHKHLLAYTVSSGSQPSRGRDASRLPVAQCLPCNTIEAVPIENEHFQGKVLLLYRPVEGLDYGHPYYDHFASRKRNWEFRIQGRFKQAPTGELFVGAILRDFDYDQSVATSSIFAMNTAMSLIKYQYRMYFSWGARCKDALKPDAELGQAVSDLTIFDQIIVTPGGRPVPPLQQDLDEVSDVYGLSLMRRDIGLAEYSRMCKEVMQSLNTEDTYTFRLWGLSQLLDVLNWQLKIGARVSLDHFMKDFPIHICMYELHRDSDSDDPRHLEKRKRYIFDLMGWSNVVTVSPALYERYAFVDPPEGFELQVMRQASGNSFHSLNSGSFHMADSQERKPFWRRWMDRLRGIPRATCASDSQMEHEYNGLTERS